QTCRGPHPPPDRGGRRGPADRHRLQHRRRGRGRPDRRGAGPGPPGRPGEGAGSVLNPPSPPAPGAGADPSGGLAPPRPRPERSLIMKVHATLETAPRLVLHAETAADLMTPNPVSVSENALLREALTLL